MAPYPSGVSYAFGPGGITPAVKVLIITNVVAFLLNMIVGDPMTMRLGLSPQAVFEQAALWQPFTYLFLHSTGGFGHILINMLSLWMFGTELERMWGTRFFTKSYLITGIGAAATTLALAMFVDDIYYPVTVGASGVIYGLLLAYGMYFPNRPIYLVLHLPDSGPHLRDDRRRHRVHFGDERTWQRRRALRAPRRTGGRLPLPEDAALAADGRAQVPLPALEDGPRPQPLRRLLRRPIAG